MRKLSVVLVIIFLSLIIGLAACEPTNIVTIEPTELIYPTKPGTSENQAPFAADLEISLLQFEWPEIQSQDSCIGEIPSPEIKLCLENNGGESAKPEAAMFAFPASLVPESQAAVLQNLPGGNWGMPQPISINGFPGVDGSLQGVIIVEGQPKPENSGVGIIIVNNLPGPYGNSQGIIIIDSMPGPEEGVEGIIIVNTIPAAENVSQVMRVGVSSKQSEDDSLGIIIVENSPVPEAGLQADPMNLAGIPGMCENPQGIPFQNFDFIIADNKEGIIIQCQSVGDESGQVMGIVIIEKPIQGVGSEGIIIVNTIPVVEKASYLMGIVVVDKPADDIGEEGIVIQNFDFLIDDNAEGIIIQGEPVDTNVEGIIIVNNVPGPDNNQGIILIDSMPGVDINNKGIIVVDSMPISEMNAEGIIWGGMPAGFDMDEMMAMMGEGGFPPGPTLFTRVELQAFGFPAELGSGEEACIQVAVNDLPGTGDSGDGYLSPDSFFDIEIEFVVTIPQVDESEPVLKEVVEIPLPFFSICTSTPELLIRSVTPTITSTATPVPVSSTNTPTARVTYTPEVQPTDTTYTRPTNTLASRITKTPTGRSP